MTINTIYDPPLVGLDPLQHVTVQASEGLSSVEVYVHCADPTDIEALLDSAQREVARHLTNRESEGSRWHG